MTALALHAGHEAIARRFASEDGARLAIAVPRGTPGADKDALDELALCHGWALLRVEPEGDLLHRVYVRGDARGVGHVERLERLRAAGRLEAGGRALLQALLARRAAELERLRAELAPLLDVRSMRELRQRPRGGVERMGAEEADAVVHALLELATFDAEAGRHAGALPFFRTLARLAASDPELPVDPAELWVGLAEAAAHAGTHEEASGALARLDALVAEPSPRAARHLAAWSAWRERWSTPLTQALDARSDAARERQRERARAARAQLATRTPSAPALAAPPPAARYAHPRFGEGTLLETTPSGLRIRFDDGSVRTLREDRVTRRER